MNLNAIRSEDEILCVLRAAQERIRLPENWCQGKFGACLSDFEPVCAWGAIRWACGDKDVQWTTPFRYLDRAAIQMGHGGLATLNDYTDHPTVKAMFDRAQKLRLADMLETVGAL